MRSRQLFKNSRSFPSQAKTREKGCQSNLPSLFNDCKLSCESCFASSVQLQYLLRQLEGCCCLKNHPIQLRRFSAPPPFQNGYHLYYVHVQLDCSTSYCHHPSYPWTVRGNKRAADSHSFWISSHAPPTRSLPGQDPHRAFARCLWNNQGYRSFQASWEQQG